MNIFIRLNICGFFQREYIRAFIQDFFLLMNIFEDSFGMLDFNEYIGLKPLNKITFVIQTNLGNMKLQRLILK